MKSSTRFLRFVVAVLVFSAVALRAFVPPFNEEFDDNKAQWLSNDKGDTWVEKIEGGKFHFENLSAHANSANWRTRPVELPPGNDFEIALRIVMSDGPPDGEAGIIWDYDPGLGTGKRRHFHVSRDGSYRIYHFNGTAFVGYAVVAKNPKIKLTGENELIIRVIGARAFFLVNGSAIDAIDLDPARGKFIGIVISSGVSVEADHFHVRTLDTAADARVAEARKLEAEARASLIAAGPPLNDFVETFDDNSRNWPYLTEGDGWKARIAGGTLEWENRTKEGKQNTIITQPVNLAADYEIGFRARDLNGGKSLISVSWGFAVGASSLEFGFTSAGYYVFSFFNAGVSTNAVPWTQTTLVKPADFNVLKVRKLGRTLFLFINDQVVADAPAFTATGNLLGLGTAYGTTAAFDEVRISYPKLTEQQATAEAGKYLAALKAGHGKPGLGIVSSEARKEEIRTAQSKKEMQQLEDQRWKLTDADDKQLDKVRRQFSQKKMIALFAAWGRPAKITMEGGAVYYNYKLVGRTQYYYWFQISKTGNKQEDWSISNIVFTDNPL